MKRMLVLLGLVLPVFASAQGFETTLRGTVEGRPESKTLVLTKVGEDPRDLPCEIPIVEGRFEYLLKGEHVEQYELVFLDELQRGSVRVTAFFPDAPVVEFEFGPDKYEVTAGGGLNRRLDEFKRERSARWARSAEYDDLNATLGELHKAGKRETPEFERLLDRQRFMTDSLRRVNLEMEYDLIAQSDDLVAYSFLAENLVFGQYPADVKRLEVLSARFAAAFPGHPYGRIVATGLGAAKMVGGGRFIDFTAPDLDGVEHTLSREIEGKVALIDLWASWCGGCIKTSRTVVPVYNEYKDRGFTVVGVAREFGDTADLVVALAREKFPWLNLLELDDRVGIWERYGVPNAGGSTFLVDRNGNVVKKNPTAEEIREYLEKNL